MVEATGGSVPAATFSAWERVRRTRRGPCRSRPGAGGGRWATSSSSHHRATGQLAVAGNFQAHIEEGGGQRVDKTKIVPKLFIKPSSAIIGPGEAVTLPSVSNALDWELELAIVIGTRGRDIPLAKARDYIGGYSVINDISARSMQWGVPGREPSGFDDFFDWLNGQWGDGFAALGPWITTTDSVSPDPNQLEMTLKVNDKVWQHGSTADMIFSPEEIIAFASRFMTLEPGDVIAGGTLDGTGDAAVSTSGGGRHGRLDRRAGTSSRPSSPRRPDHGRARRFRGRRIGFMGQTWAGCRNPSPRRDWRRSRAAAAPRTCRQHGVEALDVDALFGRDDIDAVVIARRPQASATHRGRGARQARAGRETDDQPEPTPTPWSQPQMPPASGSPSSRSIGSACADGRQGRHRAGRIGDIRMIGLRPERGLDIPAVTGTRIGPRCRRTWTGGARLRHRPLAGRPRGHAPLRPFRELPDIRRPTRLDGPLRSTAGPWSRSG